MDQATQATSGLSARRSRAARPSARRLPRRLLRALRDDRLVVLLQAGHLEAFEAIYDRHQAAILSFCRHMLGSRCEGEDAAQQTFLSAYRHLVDSANPIVLRPWLYAIARNNCLSQLRARRALQPIDEVVSDRPDTEGLIDQVQRRDDLRALLGDLAALPEQQRAALVLSELGDLSHREIADVLACEPNRVKALVYQARSSLMAQRGARELDCVQVREQLSVARGHDLLRGELRRHVRSCEACREFAADVKRQRRALALILPVIPTLAFRHATLAPVLGSAGNGLAPATGIVGKGFALKAVAATVAASVGVGAGIALVPGHQAKTPTGRASPSSARAHRAARVSTPAPGHRYSGHRASIGSPASVGAAPQLPASTGAPVVLTAHGLPGVTPTVTQRGHANGHAHVHKQVPARVRSHGQHAQRPAAAPPRGRNHAQHQAKRGAPKPPTSLQHGGRKPTPITGNPDAVTGAPSTGRGH